MSASPGPVNAKFLEEDNRRESTLSIQSKLSGPAGDKEEVVFLPSQKSPTCMRLRDGLGPNSTEVRSDPDLKKTVGQYDALSQKSTVMETGIPAGTIHVRRQMFWDGPSEDIYDDVNVTNFIDAEVSRKRRGVVRRGQRVCKSIWHTLYTYFKLFINPFLMLLETLCYPVVNHIPGWSSDKNIGGSVTMSLWGLVIFTLLYGFDFVFKNLCAFDVMCIRWSNGTAWTMIARMSGKGITATFTLGMLFVMRPVVEYTESLPYVKRWTGSWRKMHMWLMNAALLLSLIHTWAHVQRRATNPLPFWVEELKTWTGILLFVLWVFMGIPVWLKPFVEFKCGCPWIITCPFGYSSSSKKSAPRMREESIKIQETKEMMKMAREEHLGTMGVDVTFQNDIYHIDLVLSKPYDDLMMKMRKLVEKDFKRRIKKDSCSVYIGESKNHPIHQQGGTELRDRGLFVKKNSDLYKRLKLSKVTGKKVKILMRVLSKKKSLSSPDFDLPTRRPSFLSQNDDESFYNETKNSRWFFSETMKKKILAQEKEMKVNLYATKDEKGSEVSDRSIRKKRSDNGYLLRVIFRICHVPCFVLICIAYTLHCSEIIPLILLFLWEYSYRRRQLQPVKILFAFVQGDQRHKRNVNRGDRYVLKLKIKFGKTSVPDKYGYYVVLHHGYSMCSYTLIPKDGGKEIELNIRHCTFIDKVLDEIVARTAECDELEKMETGELWYDLGADFFQVYGPFASSDYTIANTRRVAVLVQSTGSTVSESVIKFQNLRRYWEKVIVVVVGSDLMDYQPEVPSRGRLSSLVFENTNVVGFKRNEAKYRWVMNRIEREIFYRGRRRPCEIVRKSNGETYLTPPESKKKWNHFTTGLSKSEKAKLLCSESAALYPNSVIMRNFDIKEDVGSEHDIVVFGFQRLQTELAEHILKNLQMNDFDMIVCSGVWLQHIQTILEKDKNSVDPEIHLEKTKLHMELFDC